LMSLTQVAEITYIYTFWKNAWNFPIVVYKV